MRYLRFNVFSLRLYVLQNLKIHIIIFDLHSTKKTATINVYKVKEQYFLAQRFLISTLQPIRKIIDDIFLLCTEIELATVNLNPFTTMLWIPSPPSLLNCFQLHNIPQIGVSMFPLTPSVGALVRFDMKKKKIHTIRRFHST